MRGTGPLAATVALAAYGGLHWLGRTAGATRAERQGEMPGDDIVERPLIFLTTHATTIHAPPEAIWPWLVQVGWHRGGWYTARWVDRLLFPANWPSSDEIVESLQHLEVGDFVPDGPPESGAGFVVERLERDRHLVLHSRTHLPPGWGSRFGAWVDWTWAFALDPLGPGRTRFRFRARGRVGPWWLAAGYWFVIVPADFVMSAQMMRGIKERAERGGSVVDGTVPSSPTAHLQRPQEPEEAPWR